MPKFRRPFIEKILDVKSDENCGFHAIAEYMGLTKESHVMVRRSLIQEVKEYRSDYMRVYFSDDHFSYILNGLHPPKNSSGIALEDKWFTLPNMGGIIATYYNRVVVELTNHEIGILETFFFFQLLTGHRLTQKLTSCALA